MTDEQMGYIRIIVIILSIGYGVWQHLQKRKLEKYVANKALGLSKIIGIALGATQSAYKNQKAVELASKEIGRAEGLTNAALVESADIYCNLQQTTIDDIDDLINSGSIINSHKNIFVTFSQPKIGLIRRFFRWLNRLY